ncbi:MAG TPA: hypothetical protein VF642_10860, partial [Propionibacteriaceae bacterium]
HTSSCHSRARQRRSFLDQHALPYVQDRKHDVSRQFLLWHRWTAAGPAEVERERILAELERISPLAV